jgi:hypothetical protein
VLQGLANFGIGTLARSLWLAVPACLAAPIATAAFLAVEHDDIRPPLVYAAAALPLALIAGWVFLMESLWRAPSVRG